jgi:hypothetical protein
MHGDKMKQSLVLLALLSFAACSKEAKKAGTATSPISGIDANSVYSKLTAHLDQSGLLPRAGETKSEVATIQTAGTKCRYTGNYTYAIANVTAQGFDETSDRAYTLVSGDGCPPIPAGKTAGHETRTVLSSDYVASRRAELKRFFDLPARVQHSSWISRIAITKTEANSVNITGIAIPVLHVSIDIVNTNGATFREVYDFSTESWFLGQVSYTLIVNNTNYMEYQVTSYQP